MWNLMISLRQRPIFDSTLKKNRGYLFHCLCYFTECFLCCFRNTIFCKTPSKHWDASQVNFPHRINLCCIVLRRWTQCEYSGSCYRSFSDIHFNNKLLWIHSYKLMSFRISLGACYQCDLSFD